MKKLIILLIFFISLTALQAQEKIQVTESDYNNEKVEMADEFREEGKIYILTGVILLIFGGIIVYLITLDRKISRLEKQSPNHDH